MFNAFANNEAYTTTDFDRAYYAAAYADDDDDDEPLVSFKDISNNNNNSKQDDDDDLGIQPDENGNINLREHMLDINIASTLPDGTMDMELFNEAMVVNNYIDMLGGQTQMSGWQKATNLQQQLRRFYNYRAEKLAALTYSKPEPLGILTPTTNDTPFMGDNNDSNPYNFSATNSRSSSRSSNRSKSRNKGKEKVVNEETRGRSRFKAPSPTMSSRASSQSITALSETNRSRSHSLLSGYNSRSSSPSRSRSNSALPTTIIPPRSRSSSRSSGVSMPSSVGTGRISHSNSYMSLPSSVGTSGPSSRSSSVAPAPRAHKINPPRDDYVPIKKKKKKTI